MKIRIKSFDVDMELKNKGIEFEVRSPKDEFRGDCVITKTKIIWCEGKTDRKNGKAISWDAFIT